MLRLNSIQCELFSLSLWIFLFLFVDLIDSLTELFPCVWLGPWESTRTQGTVTTLSPTTVISRNRIVIKTKGIVMNTKWIWFLLPKDTFCRYRLFLQVIKMLFLIAFFAKCERRIRLNVSALKYWFWTWCLQLEIILWWYFCRQLLLLTKYGLVKWAFVISFFSSFPVPPKWHPIMF